MSVHRHVNPRRYQGHVVGVFCSLYFLRQGLLLSLELSNWLQWMAEEPLAASCLSLPKVVSQAASPSIPHEHQGSESMSSQH